MYQTGFYQGIAVLTKKILPEFSLSADRGPGVNQRVLNQRMYARSELESEMTRRQHADLQRHDLLPLSPNVMNRRSRIYLQNAAAQPDCGFQGAAMTEKNVARIRHYSNTIPKVSARSMKLLLCKFCLV